MPKLKLIKTILLPTGGVIIGLLAVFIVTSITNTYLCRKKTCIRVVVYEDLFGVQWFPGKKDLEFSLISFASEGAPTIKRSGKTNFLGHYTFTDLPPERKYYIHLLDYASVGGDAAPCPALQNGNINLAHYYQVIPPDSITVIPTAKNPKHTIFIALKKKAPEERELETTTGTILDGSWYGPPFRNDLFELDTGDGRFFLESEKVDLKPYLNETVKTGYCHVAGVIMGETPLIRAEWVEKVTPSLTEQ